MRDKIHSINISSIYFIELSNSLCLYPKEEVLEQG